MDRYARMVMVALVFLATGVAPTQARGAEKLLSFDTMAPVAPPYTGGANAIRGVNGGGLPWIVRSARGELKADGRVEVSVRGLVLADDPSVPVARRLVNPFAAFRVVVSCLSTHAGSAATVNVATGEFPASPAGDSEIEAAVDLPRPCIAPVILVTSPGGAWFAATGG